MWNFPGIGRLEVMLGLLYYGNDWHFTDFCSLSIGGPLGSPFSPPLPLPYLTQIFLEPWSEGGHCRCQTWAQKQFSWTFSLQAYIAASHPAEGVAWACELALHFRMPFMHLTAAGWDVTYMMMAQSFCWSLPEFPRDHSVGRGRRQRHFLPSLPEALPSPWLQLRLDKPTIGPVALSDPVLGFWCYHPHHPHPNTIPAVHMAYWFSWPPIFSSSLIFSQLFSLLCHQIWIKYFCLKHLVISLFLIGLWLL